MESQPEPKNPPLAARIQECPVCRHALASHDEEGACRIKDCWCLYHPPEGDIEVE